MIAVHPECQLYNPAAIQFSKVFYSNLLRNSTIELAFQRGRESVREFSNERVRGIRCKHTHSQCHLNSGFSTHVTGLPECTCGSDMVSQYHRIDCKWVMKFIEKYNKNREFTEREREEEKVFACCCSPEVPHDTYNQFIINDRGGSTRTETVTVTSEVYEVIDLPKSPVHSEMSEEIVIKRNEKSSSCFCLLSPAD